MRHSFPILATLLSLLLTSACGDGASSLPPSSGYVTSDGYQIYFETAGDGPALILVHGWSSNVDNNWKETGWMAALAQKRLVVAIDIRGHGSSEKPLVQSAYSYAAMAEDVLAVMNRLGIARADYVGYSLGAFSGSWLLGRHAERFSSAVLIGIGDENEASIATAEPIAAALRATSIEDVVDSEAVLYRIFADRDPRNNREALALAALQMWPEGFPLQLGGEGLLDVTIPVLILNGESDVPYVLTDQNLAAAIPTAMLVEIPGANHFSVFTDGRFLEEVIHFLP